MSDGLDGGLSEFDQIANDATEAKRMSKSWQSAGKVIRETFAKRAADLTPEQAQIVAEFWQAVTAWDSGLITLDEFASVTGDGWLRAQCFMSSVVEESLFTAASRAFEALVAREVDQIYPTRHGLISHSEIIDVGGRVLLEADPNTGEWLVHIQFPTGIDKNTGRAIWPTTSPELERQYYVSPFRTDWFAGKPEAV